MPQFPVRVCDLGRAAYVPAWHLQEAIQERAIKARRAGEPVAHTLLLVEHPPVYTLGKSGDRSHLLIDEKQLEEIGATFEHVDRGGDITWHGPGQLVGYPILDLHDFRTDIHWYLRTLEEVMIETIATYGITGGRVPGRTGVWVGPDERGPERKICAFGIRCSRWVTMHGWALNMNPDLGFFSNIVPCGIQDRGVTSLALETGGYIERSDVIVRLLEAFARNFEVRLEAIAPAQLKSDLTGETLDEDEIAGILDVNSPAVTLP